MSQTTPPTEKPSWLSRAFRFTVRILFAVILGLVVGTGIYLGVTYLANRYFQSVQVNSQRIQALEDNQSLAESQSKQRLDDVISRLQSLETSGNSQKVFEADIQSRIAALETAQPAQAALQETLTNEQQQVDTLQANLTRFQSTMQTNLAQVQSTQLAFADDLDGIAQGSTDQMAVMQTLSAEWADAKTSIASSLLNVHFLRSMELLTRARFNLVQNNLGLARQDIQAARDGLLAIQSQVPEDQASTITNLLTRLESALNKLPGFPVAASDDIEGAWNLLTMETGSMSPSGTPVSGTPTPTQDQTPGPTVTPTPSPTTKP